MSNLALGIPLSLYIHLPWCIEKCPYCDFNSHPLTSDFDEQLYVNSLLTDLEQDLPKVWGRTVDSIFIGGGTPSLFSGTAIDTLMSGIRSRLMLRPDLEITLESNPGSADVVNYNSYKQIGINRLSIGVQSFNDQQLTKLGRIHNADQATSAFQTARDAGFKRINLDLMFALPGQSINEAMADLDAAIALEPEHISWYQLTIETNTVFHADPPEQLPDDDLMWEIQMAGVKKLQCAGYQQYEVSAWSKPGERCKHNLNYWQFGDYLGIGAGAHGKITDFGKAKIYRTRRKKQPRHWLTPDFKTLANSALISNNELALEFMLNAMRLNDGVPAEYFTERTGLSYVDIAGPMNDARKQGYLEKDDQNLRPTHKGFNYLNDLLALFLSDTISVKEIN